MKKEINLESMSVEEFREYQMKRIDGFVKYWNQCIESENHNFQKKIDIDDWFLYFEEYSEYIFGCEHLYVNTTKNKKTNKKTKVLHTKPSEISIIIEN